LALFAALTVSLLVSAQGADAQLKSEWKFGGSFARTIMAIPGASAMFGGLSSFDFDNDGMLPSAVQPTGGSLGGLFSRPGLVGGFAAGFLGAGVFGLVFGHGLIGEISGTASLLGLVFQLALLAMLARLIWTWWHVDKAAAMSELSPRQLADAYGRPRHEMLPDVEGGADEPERDALKQSDLARH
jgi:hypothetical protein